jgi:Tfp pilus assembly protein PilW
MKRKHNHHRHAAGFTVVECLISLAICAMLMTAVAVAFNASLINFRENEDMFQSINNARQALSRMTSQLRTANDVSSAAPANQCIFWTGTTPPELLTYEYRSADKKLYVITNADGNEYTLCNNVTAAAFSKTPSDGDPNDAKSVLISLSVKCGGSERTLSAAAVVRRAL